MICRCHLLTILAKRFDHITPYHVKTSLTTVKLSHTLQNIAFSAQVP